MNVLLQTRPQKGFNAEDSWSIDATERLLEPVLRRILKAQDVEYAWGSDIDRLDTHYGVDAIARTPRRNVALAIRVRGRSYFDRYGDITIRYESLRTLGKALEMQKSIARFMLYAWVDTDFPLAPSSVVSWHLVWLQRLVDKFLSGDLVGDGPIPNRDGSSTFMAFPVSRLNEYRLIYRSGGALVA